MAQSTPYTGKSGMASSAGYAAGSDGSAAGSSTAGEAKKTVRKVRADAEQYVRRGQSRLARQVNSLSHALEEAADRLEEESPMAAGPTRRLAAGMGSLSDALDSRSMEELFQDLQDFAHRNPALVIGGAAALGFLAGRFMKSSGERSHGYRSGRYHESMDPAFSGSSAYGSGMSSSTAAPDVSSSPGGTSSSGNSGV